jgi:uncharacterized protein (TIGR02996 family)
MFAIVVSRAGEPAWRKTFAANQVTIGSSADAMLRLAPESADAMHARIVMRTRKLIVVDLKSAGGTYVDRRRLTAPLVIDPASELAIGDYTLRAFVVDDELETAPPERGPIERDLLAAIERGDDSSRLVYADWLESIDDAPRAEFLRLQHALATMSPDAADFERATDRLRELAAGLELGWRARVAKRSIEACPPFDFECPKRWEELGLTERPDVRHCGA